MTRKDYELIAAAALSAQQAADALSETERRQVSPSFALRQFLDAFASAAHAQNSAFNRARFINAATGI